MNGDRPLVRLIAAALLGTLVTLRVVRQHQKLRAMLRTQEYLESQVEARTAELLDSNQRLAEAARAKSDFLDRMSHELRTPMNGVVGMTELLSRTVLTPAQEQLTRTISSSARLLLRIVNDLLDLAKHATVPVINGLSDLLHPCQTLADYFTLREHHPNLKGLKVCYIGDGNNVCNELMMGAAKLGMTIAVASPEGYEPDAQVVAQARLAAKETGAEVAILHDPETAVEGADAIYTDAWASMGQEDEIEERNGIFAPYRVDARLMARAKAGAFFMHCLPAHRGSEVTQEVMDGPQCIAYDIAENRLHVQKALLALLIR